MKTFKQDLFAPLPKVERAWLRKPATILMTVIGFIVFIPFALLDGWIEFYKGFTIPCWYGEDEFGKIKKKK